MKASRRRTAASWSVLGFLLVLLLSASQVTAQKTKVVFATPHAPTGAPERVEYFLRDNPNIEVEIVSLSGMSVNQQREFILTMIASGQQIDVVRIGGDILNEWVNAGILLDMTPYVEALGADILGDMHPFARNAVTKNGRIYALPEDSTSQWALVNTGNFAKAGLESPFSIYESGAWTWDKMVEAAEKLKALDQPNLPFFPIATLLRHPIGITTWIMGGGGDLFNETGTEVLVNSPESLQGIEFAVGLIERGLMNSVDNMPPGLEIYAHDRWGIAPLDVTFPSWLNANAPGTEFDVIPMPQSPFTDRDMPVHTNGYVVISRTPDPDAAMRLALWLSGPEHYTLALTGAAHPDQPYRFSWSSSYRSSDQLFIDIVSERLGIEGLKYYREVLPRLRNYTYANNAAPNAWNEAYAALDDVWRGLRSPAAGLEELEQRLQNLIRN